MCRQHRCWQYHGGGKAGRVRLAPSGSKCQHTTALIYHQAVPRSHTSKTATTTHRRGGTRGAASGAAAGPGRPAGCPLSLHPPLQTPGGHPRESRACTGREGRGKSSQDHLDVKSHRGERRLSEAPLEDELQQARNHVRMLECHRSTPRSSPPACLPTWQPLGMPASACLPTCLGQPLRSSFKNAHLMTACTFFTHVNVVPSGRTRRRSTATVLVHPALSLGRETYNCKVKSVGAEGTQSVGQITEG